MAKIITVHGTGATGPEEGDRWWQRGSLFETHIRQLVEGKDGALSFEPFIWDGANSEKSRRSAGRQLLGALLKLETSAQDHCLIGHSHGGSVISHALLAAAAKRADLPHLKTWITIGTPFIKLKRRFLLFSRVNFFGKAAIITAITHLLIYPLLFPLALTGYAIWAWPLSYLLDTLWSTTPFWLILLPPYALIYAGISYLNIRSMKAYSKKARSNFESQFSPSWLGLWHRSDEAIYGLRSIRNVRHRIFSARFAVPALLSLSLFLIPIFLVGMFVYNQPPGEPTQELPRMNYFQPLAELFSGSSPLTWVDALQGAAGMLFFVPMMFYLAALIFILGFYLVSLALSAALSRVLDRATWTQIRQSSFGNDTVGETAIGANIFPMWTSFGFEPLTGVVAEEISRLADLEASRSLVKFRNRLSELALSEPTELKSDTVSKYLSWNELVHTAYFEVPQFRKLVAYAISTTEGFRATEAFKADPDYVLAAKWYADVQPKNRGLG